MMVRLLGLKKSITEYFRVHSTNPPKLTSREWTITNEVCSVLDVVSEARIRMQGGKDTHLSQAMFLMAEVIGVLKGDSQEIRVPNASTLPPPTDGIPTEATPVSDLQAESMTSREILLEYKGNKQLEEACLKVERVCALLDPRRKMLDAAQFANGSAELRVKAEVDLDLLTFSFEDAPAPQSVPAPALAQDDPPVQPPSAKKGKLSILQKRGAERLAQAAAAGGGGSEGTGLQPGGVGAGPGTPGRRVLVGRELLLYLAEAPQLDEDDFNLLGF